MVNALVLALLAGAMLPLQAAINSRLERTLGSPVWASAVSGAVTTVALLLIGLLTVRGAARGGVAPSLPWWAWTGGLCGAFVLVTMIVTAPKLGTATMIAMIVAGQVLFSLAVDLFGLFGLPSQSLTPRPIIAASLIVVGGILFSVRTR